MGLYIAPGGAEWSYHGFARFRERLAAEEGIDLRAMAGFTDGVPGIGWDTTTTSLRPLLDHSDCDGFIESHDCEDMLPRLRQIRDTWSEAGPPPGLGIGDVLQLGRLIGGLEHCAAHGCAVAFR